MAKISIGSDTRYALEGRVVTMTDSLGTIESGVVYVEGSEIVDVRRTSDPPPEGFGNSTVIKTAGTIYPGLIELHNHLSYDILPMWMVPEQFEESAQWRRVKYKGVTTGPLDVLGGLDGYLQAIVRYAECKLLVSEQCGGAVLLKRLDQQGIINLDVG